MKNFLNEYISVLEKAKDESIIHEFHRNSFSQAIRHTFKQIQNQIPILSPVCEQIYEMSDYWSLDEIQRKELQIRFENSLYAVINRRIYGRININLILSMVAINLICFLYEIAQEIQNKENSFSKKIEEFLNLFGDITLHIEYGHFY